jgi:hypothetical protein
LVTTTQPTPEFRRHHDVEDPRVDERAFRQGWIVRTRLDQLLADGRITRAEWQAASEYRATWAIARELVGIEPGMIRVAGSSSIDAAMIARVDAVTKLRLVEAAIGSLAARLLLACLVHDLRWAAIARFVRKDPQTVRDWTVLAIRALASAWGTLHGRQDVDPPLRRRQVVLGPGRGMSESFPILPHDRKLRPIPVSRIFRLDR